MSDPLHLLYLSYAAVFGAIIGSFLNVVILRLPKRLEWSWRQEAMEILEIDPSLPPHVFAKPPGIAIERSACPLCATPIRWYDNIPVVSFLFLRGRSRCCKAPISWQYPIVEAATSAVFVVSYLTFGATGLTLAVCALSAAFIALAGIDAHTQYLPDQITLPALWAVLLFSLTEHALVSPSEAIIGAAAGYLSLWSLYWVFKLATGKEGMGYGDFKLMAVIGAFWGAACLPVVAFAAAMSGGVIGIALYFRRGESAPFPFGPFLVLGVFLYAFLIRPHFPDLFVFPAS